MQASSISSECETPTHERGCLVRNRSLYEQLCSWAMMLAVMGWHKFFCMSLESLERGLEPQLRRLMQPCHGAGIFLPGRLLPGAKHEAVHLALEFFNGRQRGSASAAIE